MDDDDCQTLQCQHHGICTVPFEPIAEKGILESDENDGSQVSSAYCQCPLGFDGQFCETPVEVQVRKKMLIRFRSYLSTIPTYYTNFISHLNSHFLLSKSGNSLFEKWEFNFEGMVTYQIS